jgi:thiamine-phosphate pyrophosphorylase
MDRGAGGKSAFDALSEVIPNGIRWMQLREKNGTRREIFKTARLLKTMTAANDVMLIINDHADIAMAVNADGVHLGQDDLPLAEARKIMGAKIIGISTHSLEQAIEAAEGGADYIGFGPIYQTKTKDAGPPKGVEELRIIKERIGIPVVAVGGITEDNLTEVFEAGADAVAVSSGIMKRRNIAQAARRYVALIEALIERLSRRT